ncbi:MAG: class I tRNA ligase family protein, partial [Euryarchaeota archaeon]|nr:class I tRNA ligase family protein [Euryarchaeota archaeon]
DGSIYFAISRFDGYGRLSGIDLGGLKKGARVSQDEYGKEDPRDFALWKAWHPDDGEVLWDTELGRGRPGWHTECSAMAMKYLGETLDIHAGGVDLIFPHHENEIAQAEGATGKTFVRYWLHNEHLLVEGQKMSKSLGNFYTLRDLLERGHSPLAVRYLLLSSHYRQKLNFTFKRLRDAERTVERLRDFVARLRDAGTDAPWNEDLHKKTEEALREFEERMDDDLDTPRALAAVFELVRETNRAIEDGAASRENLDEVRTALLGFDRVLGILEEEKEELPGELAALIKEREEARKRRDFATADRIRAELKERGILLEDGPGGTRWRRV